MLYAATAVIYRRAFKSRQRETYRLGRQMFSGTLLAHLAFIIYFTVIFRRMPIATVSETFGTFVFLTAATYWVLESWLHEFSMGVLLFPIFLILLAIGNLTFRGDEAIAPILKDVKFGAHVIAMLLGYGAFLLSFIASLLHQLLIREIRQHQLGVFYSRLPSLPFFEKISNSAIDIGLVFATIGMGLGIYFASKVWGNSVFGEPKLFSAALTWVIYCVHAIGRRAFNFSGQRAANIALAGFGWLMFSYLIISMLFTKIHYFA
ncbi:MAG: cytochrome c biogenesis protein CcsA [Calditrichia bacterium]